MNKKYYILLLVIFISGALVAGGTYAWRTFSNVTLTNATHDMSTRYFTFTTSTGTSVGSLYPFPHQPTRHAIIQDHGYITLSLTKVANSPPASSVKLMLKFSQNNVNVSDYIKVAVCRNATSSNCNNSSANEIPTTVNNNTWVVTNKSLLNTTEEQLIFEDTSSTNSPFRNGGSVTTTYYIYFWLNAAVVDNDNAATLASSPIVGDIYFYATQGV